MNLISVDPGEKTGAAWFEDGRLVEAGVWTFGDFMSRKMSRTLKETDVVIEVPRWYPHDAKDVNDLLDLSVKVGRIQQLHLDFFVYVKTELVFPRTWKGTVPKPIHNKRVIEALTPEELKLVPLRPRARTVDHNCADAIGLGLWKLGRMR